MNDLWLLFVVGLATGFISEKLLVSSQSASSSGDDLYLEGRASGGFPIDDEDGEDYGSGSGSGAYSSLNATEEDVINFLNITHIILNKEPFLNQPTITTDSPHTPPATAGERHDPTTAETRTVTTATALPEEKKDEEVLVFGSTVDWITHGPSTTNTPPSETTTTKLSTVVSVTKVVENGVPTEGRGDETTLQNVGNEDAVPTEGREDDTTLQNVGNEDAVPTEGREDDTTLQNVGNEDAVPTEGREDDTTLQNVGNEDVINKAEDDVLSERGRSSRLNEETSAEEVTSENLWERMDVLAAVIACGVVGFLCAIFLLALLAYRMKKKDEGSYNLGDTKLSETAYQKAPTQEFYA